MCVAAIPTFEGGRRCEMEIFDQVIQNVIGFLKMVRLTDLIDIAIAAYLIYRLMLLVRRTSAAQVAKAILLILAALWMADMLQLNVIEFVLGRTVELGFLALVIVFQPEIRKFLEQMGRSKLSRVFSHEAGPSELENAITQTVAAYTALSKDKVGALMVFERRNLLDEIIKTGTIVDATASAELLKNLFWNKAPLHDGAVIVRGGRIAGAGCMLPLSANVNLSRDLGMRHRAGIGMSEHSDAVVAIVSEETGSISVAVGGMLKRHLAPETLERLLRNELISDEPEKKTNNGLLSIFFKGKKGEKNNDEERKGE